MSHPLVKHLRAEMNRLKDPDKAAPMSAYMKHIQPFYGITSQVREAIIKAAKSKFPLTGIDAYRAAIFELWQGEFREDRYMAVEVAQNYKQFVNRDSFSIYEEMVFTADWWDTLDWIANKIVSPLLMQHREFEKNLVDWRTSAHLWTRRAALLAHIKHKKQTNTTLLSETILMLAHEKEFFIRKAIGWILREYSKTDPVWVSDFVARHDSKLSNLSKREALKVIRRKAGER